MTIEEAFGRLAPVSAAAMGEREALCARLRELSRFYHNEAHIVSVLSLLETWTGGEMPLPLLAAALYHDAVYDATRSDNEILSMACCHDALVALGGWRTGAIYQAADLIWTTATHVGRSGSAEEVLLLDADLWILGAEPATYQGYVDAIRQEYVHVCEADWRTGRAAVLDGLLALPRLYRSEAAERVEARTCAARANMTAELDRLRAA